MHDAPMKRSRSAVGHEGRAKQRLPIAKGPRWTPALLSGLAVGESHVLGPLLAARSPESAREAAEQAAQRADELIETEHAKAPPPSPIACQRACSFCCHAKVLATAPEVLRVAAFLRSTLDDDALAALRAQVDEAASKTQGLDREARLRARVPCPLLVDGCCSVYEARPLVCRGWSSLDAGACERHLAAPETRSAPVYAAGYELANAVLAGLSKACSDAGLDGAPLELIAALRIALTRENAADRWARGLFVFSTAHDAEWQSKRDEQL